MLIRFSFFIKQKAKGNVSEFLNSELKNFCIFPLSTVKNFTHIGRKILTAKAYIQSILGL